MATRKPPRNTPIHMDFLYGFLLKGTKSMWISVLWAGLQVAMWITHMGGKFRHGLSEKSLNHFGLFRRRILGKYPVAPCLIWASIIRPAAWGGMMTIRFGTCFAEVCGVRRRVLGTPLVQTALHYISGFIMESSTKFSD